MRNYPPWWENEEQKKERIKWKREQSAIAEGLTAANNNSNELDDERRNWTDAHDTGSIPEEQTLSLTDDYRKLKEGHRLMETETEPGDMEPPKPISEQIAKTTKGRVMQDYAGMVRDEVQGAVGLEQFPGDVEERERRIENDYFRSVIGERSYFEKNGHEIHISGGLKPDKLLELKHALENLRLPGTKKKGKRERQLATINKLLGEIETMMKPEKVERTKNNVIKVLANLDEIYDETLMAKLEKKWSKLEWYNERCIRLVKELYNKMIELGANEPDELINIMDDLANTERIYDSVKEPAKRGEEEYESDEKHDKRIKYIEKIKPQLMRAYKTALIQFAETHALPRISESVLEFLRGKRRNNKKNTFVDALLAAYLNKPKYDDPVRFMKRISRIPENRFDESYKRVTGETIPREVREAA